MPLPCASVWPWLSLRSRNTDGMLPFRNLTASAPCTHHLTFASGTRPPTPLKKKKRASPKNSLTKGTTAKNQPKQAEVTAAAHGNGSTEGEDKARQLHHDDTVSYRTVSDFSEPDICMVLEHSFLLTHFSEATKNTEYQSIFLKANPKPSEVNWPNVVLARC